MWEKEAIPDEDFVYRQCHFRDLSKGKGVRFPNEAHFKPDPDGLSVNWDKKIKLDEVFIIIGNSHKANAQFKNHRDFQVFKFQVGILKSIPGIEAVVHDPTFYENPSPIGFPNNPAHTLVKYPDDEEIRVNLSDYAREHYEDTFCSFDVNSLNKTIEELRERLPDVPYNRDWIK